MMKNSIKTKSSEKKSYLPEVTVVKPISISLFKKEGVFLPYLRYSKLQERTRLKERLEIGIQENYKLAYKELRKRLHIDTPADDFRSITDYDDTFFTCIKYNFTPNYVAPYKSLKFLYNNQLRWKQEVGYRRDSILNIEDNFKREREVYDDTVNRYNEQVKFLDDFISADYQKSMLFLNKWEKVKIAVNKKSSELQYLASEMFTMASKILGLDYRYGIQQKYGRFLYYLSPPSWRLKHRNFALSIEIEAKGFDFGTSSEEDTFNVIFENLKRECSTRFVEPVLYFNNPNNLLDIFDGIEKQQLNHFTHVARLAPHAALLKKGIKLFKDIIKQDSAYILTIIKEFEKMLQFHEEQCFQLERNFFNILNGLFYENVASPDVLKLQSHLEFCYEKIFREKPMNLGIMVTAKALEDFYMDYTMRLESVTSDDIKSAIIQSVASERNKYKKAKMAAKELRQFKRLERSLLRSYAPIPVNKSLITTYNVKRPLSKTLVPKITSENNNRNVLSEAEMDYLTLFTDWNGKEDPANYLKNFIVEDYEHRDQ